MDRLLAGYRRFRAEVWPAERARYEALAHEGQSPETLVVACSDSRVDPQTIFGAAPGELFVVRNVAGLIPPYHVDAGYHGTSAALEFAVRVLKVARIVVLSHAQCGGIKAMVDGAPAVGRDFIQNWMEIASPVLHSIPGHLHGAEILGHCENAVVRLSLANLATFPWIAEAVASERIALQGFRFDIRTGVLAKLEGDRFQPVD